MARKVKEKKDPNVLECTQVSYVNVDWTELERFIKHVTGQKYEIAYQEEWGNDSQHSFNTSHPSDYDREKYDLLCAGTPRSYSLRSILNCLAADGKLAKGQYLVTVCW